MLCPVHLENLVKLSAASPFLPTKTSMSGKEDNRRQPLLYGRFYTGKRVSAPPKFISWAEELVKKVTMKSSMRNKSLQDSPVVTANQYSKCPTPLIQRGILPLIFVIFGSRIPGLANVCYISPLSCCQLQSISTALPWKKSIVYFVVSGIPVPLLLIFHTLGLQPQPSSGYETLCLMNFFLPAAFVDISFGTCSPPVTIFGRLETS